MNTTQIVIMGGGSLGSAIARALVQGNVSKDAITIVQRNHDKRKALEAEGFRCLESAIGNNVLSTASTVFLAIKPKDLAEAWGQLSACLVGTSSIISVIAGVTGDELLALFDKDYPLYRVKLSVLAEVMSGPVPLYCCNQTALDLVETTRQFLAPLGEVSLMSEIEMDMSGWDMSSLPCVLIGRLLAERLAMVPSERQELVAQLLLSGLQREVMWLASRQNAGVPIVEALTDLSRRIATPGGVNDATISFLESRSFWQTASDARDFYQKRLELSQRG